MIHTASSCTYGPPRVQAVLPAHGRRISRARIAKFMQPFGIRGLADLPRRTRTTNNRHDSPIASNLLARNFTTTQPNQIWLADITYVATNKGWLYVAGVLDLDRRSLVDWFMNETLLLKGPLRLVGWRSTVNGRHRARSTTLTGTYNMLRRPIAAPWPRRTSRRR